MTLLHGLLKQAIALAGGTQDKLALAGGFSQNAISHALKVGRVTPKLARAIERATSGKVPAEKLCPLLCGDRERNGMMADAASRRWQLEEFFAWQERQPERYELVDGFPIRMIAGARNVHDDIVVNVLAELRNQLRGGGCRPFTSDGSVETKPGQIRRPDIGVDCGRRDPHATKATCPRVVVEVLSPTTRDFDTIGRLEEYKFVDSLDRILVIEPNAPEVIVWARGADRSWRRAIRQGPDQEIDMPEIGVTLALAEIYDGVEFPARPRLAVEEPSAPESHTKRG
jgi:Uma2 family endonuclease